jgi:hypothetical protein
MIQLSQTIFSLRERENARFILDYQVHHQTMAGRGLGMVNHGLKNKLMKTGWIGLFLGVALFLGDAVQVREIRARS